MVSIKPVHSLVAGVMEGVGEPVLLVRGTGSEHSYSLRPSQARALQEADVVFWVGEALETFLLKPLQALSGNAKVIELWEMPGLTLLPTREGGMWQAQDHEDESERRESERGDADHGEGRHGAGHEDAGEHAEPTMRASTRMARSTCTAGWIPPTPRCSSRPSRPR